MGRRTRSRRRDGPTKRRLERRRGAGTEANSDDEEHSEDGEGCTSSFPSRRHPTDIGSDDDGDGGGGPLAVYKRILRTSRVADLRTHLVHIRHPDMSAAMPSGRASDSIYASILGARTFDAYGRPVPDEVDRERAERVVKKKVHGDLLDVRAEVMERTKERIDAVAEKKTRREDDGERQFEEEQKLADGDHPGGDVPSKGNNRQDEHSSHATIAESRDSSSPAGTTEERGRRKNKKLTTPSWKIGTKPVTHGPPGLAPPIRDVPNSEGNERFFSYDGDWESGQMHGEGKYRYSDGSTHEGVFRRNRPDGFGKATHNGGTVYIGEFRGGTPHGKGRATYRGGIVYDGGWKDGRRDGRGKLTFPNGSKYEGEFRRGKYHGLGTFVSGGTGMTYSGRFQRGYVSGKGTVDYGMGRPRITREWPEGSETGLTLHDAIAQLDRERKDEADAAEREREELFGPARVAKLRGYLKTVRAGIATRRKKEREDAVEERRRTIREMRAKGDGAREE